MVWGFIVAAGYGRGFSESCQLELSGVQLHDGRARRVLSEPLTSKCGVPESLMQDQGQNVFKAECTVSLPAVLVPREAQGARPSENARALLLYGVLNGGSVHRYLAFALLRDALRPSCVVV